MVRGDSCALSTMHMSLAGDKPREVRVVRAGRRAAGTDSSGTRHESISILEMHALPNVERAFLLVLPVLAFHHAASLLSAW